MKITQIIPVSQPMYALFRQPHGMEANPVICLAIVTSYDGYGPTNEIVPMILMDNEGADPRFASNFVRYCFEHELKEYDIFLVKGEE